MADTTSSPTPTDPAGFDAWARSTVDGWGFSTVDTAAREVLADGSTDPEARAVAAVWLSNPSAADVDQLRSLSHDREVSPDTSARVAALLARQVAGDGDQAVAVCERAEEDSRERGASSVARAILGRALVESLVGVRRFDEAQARLDSTRELLDSEPDAPGWLTLGLTHTQLVVLTARRAAVLRAGESSSEVDEATTTQAHQVIERALPLGPVPPAVAARIDAAGVLIEVGAVRDGIETLEAVAAAVEPLPQAWSARYRSLVSLADAHVADERFDRAIEVQRLAVAVAHDHGVVPLEGLGRQGLARQLRAIGHLEEASSQYADAAELLRAAGGVVESLWLRLERSAVHASMKDFDRARALAEAVRVDLGAGPTLPEDLRRRIEIASLQALVGAAAPSGDLATATELLVELADLEVASGAAAAPRSAAGVTAARARQWDRAVALLAQATTEARTGENPTDDLGIVALAHAAALEVAADREQALGMATTGLAIAREADHSLATARLAGMLGSVHLDDGDAVLAEEAFRSGLDAAEAGLEQDLAHRLHLDLARALDAQGRSEDANFHREAGTTD